MSEIAGARNRNCQHDPRKKKRKHHKVTSLTVQFCLDGLCVCIIRSFVSDSLQLYELLPASLLCPFPSPEDLPDPGIEPGSSALQADSFPSEPIDRLY